MGADLERLLDDVTLVTLALAIAVGWSLFNVARGAAALVEGLVTHLGPQDGSFGSVSGGGLTWVVGHRIVTLDSLVIGLIELAVALGVAVWVARRQSD